MQYHVSFKLVTLNWILSCVYWTIYSHEQISYPAFSTSFRFRLQCNGYFWNVSGINVVWIRDTPERVQQYPKQHWLLSTGDWGWWWCCCLLTRHTMLIRIDVASVMNDFSATLKSNTFSRERLFEGFAFFSVCQGVMRVIWEASVKFLDWFNLCCKLCINGLH